MIKKAYEYTEQLCKQDGLSHRTASECRRYVNTHLMTRGDRVRRLADMLIAYFNREEALLNGDETHNITSYHRVNIRMLQGEDVSQQEQRIHGICAIDSIVAQV